MTTAYWLYLEVKRKQMIKELLIEDRLNSLEAIVNKWIKT